jgi:CheY-like chemotaxis protein
MAKRILLVDDDADYLEINRTILEFNGYEIDTASSSREALEKLRGGSFDMVIIDLIMEELDSGFTLTYAVREQEKTRHLPILMLTSAQEKTGFQFQVDHDKEWMKVDDFAAKPLTPAELIARVAKLIGKE